LDFVNNNIFKFGTAAHGVQLSSEYITALENLTTSKYMNALDDAFTFNIKDESGNSIYSNILADVMNGGKRNLNSVRMDLERIVNDNTTRPDGKPTYDGAAKEAAQRQLDLIKGETSKYVMGYADDDNVGKGNANLIAVRQYARDELAKYRNNTEYGRKVYSDGLELGFLYINDSGEVDIVPGMEGQWMDYNKSKSRKAEAKANANMDITSVAAKEIADKFKKNG